MRRIEPGSEPPTRGIAGRGGPSYAAVSASMGPASAWVTEPSRVVPVTVAWNKVLIETADVIAFVPALRVYPSGFRFTITALLRPMASEQSGRGFAADGARGPHAPEAENRTGRGLRVGIKFADGRRAALERNAIHFPAGTGHEAGPFIGSGRWTSDDGIFEWEINVVGIPKDGPVEFYYRWLALDVPESVTRIDGDALRSAAARAVVLWPQSAA